ncbi:S1-like domain-containing RNA-binding protein [Crocinitomicaceae bacterium]|nr:S1-like domain-containing RNA-binding protein [Crocinitomicaceae bacterium]MDB3906692.1 S1-like domain-containing RNA-binding protein [Crocinitomicaceae bacterium]
MNLGEVNTLRVLRFTSVGAYLGDAEDNDVLLPNKYLTDDLAIDSEVEVYLYRDSEDRLVATTERPLIDLHSFAYLQTKAVNFFGAFMDWGLEKDLMVPFKEQKLKFEEGRYYLVTLQLDEATDRLFASAKVSRYLEECTEDFDPKKEVNLLICEQTDLGVKVIVENKYSGLIFNNDISRPVTPGQRTTGYVAKVREDGKLDVRLDPTSFAKVSGSSEKILEILQKKKFIPLTDKSHPDDIRESLAMSKKTFKQAIGNLYRERIIRLEKDGIYLVE